MRARIIGCMHGCMHCVGLRRGPGGEGRVRTGSPHYCPRTRGPSRRASSGAPPLNPSTPARRTTRTPSRSGLRPTATGVSAPCAWGIWPTPSRCSTCAGPALPRAGTRRADPQRAEPPRVRDVKRPGLRPDLGRKPRALQFRDGVDAGTGSSPLARGSLRPHDLRGGGRGLIPARAGLTMASTRSSTTARAHPRSRGAHLTMRRCASSRAGSSPLARGSLLLDPCVVLARGLIPARAGLTTVRPLTSGWTRAHPRSRGAHRWRAHVTHHGKGSSPLARGSLL